MDIRPILVHISTKTELTVAYFITSHHTAWWVAEDKNAGGFCFDENSRKNKWFENDKMV